MTGATAAGTTTVGTEATTTAGIDGSTGPAASARTTHWWTRVWRWTDPRTGARWTRWVRYRGLPLLAVVAFAGVVNRWHLAVPGAWRDEVATREAATRTLPELWHLVQTIDMVHLFYYTQMHVWVAVFGSGYLAMRLFSLLGVVVATAAVFLIGSRLGGLLTGVCAAVIFAMLPMVTWSAGEARSYSWVMAWGAITFLLLTTALRRRRWWCWLLFAVAAAALVATFMFASLALLAIPVVAWLRGGMRTAGWATGSLAVAAAANLPLVLAATRQQGQVDWLPKMSDQLVGLALGEAAWARTSAVWMVGTFLTVIGIVTVLARVRSRKGRWTAVLLLSWLVLPTLVLLLMTVVVPSYVPRYVAVSMPALALVIASALARLPWRASLAATVAVALLGVPSLQEARLVTAKDTGYAVVSAFVVRNDRPGDAVLYIDADFRRVGMSHPGVFGPMTDISLGQTGAASGTLYGTQASSDQILERAQQYRRVWLIGGDKVANGYYAQLLKSVGFVVTPTTKYQSGTRAVLLERA